jgi:hypothetical protein
MGYASAEARHRWEQANQVKFILIKIGWYTRHQHKWSDKKRHKKCRELVCKAIRCGIIARPSCCQGCGVPCKPDCHHDDYARLLDVQFYCRKCHNQHDREREERLGIMRAKPERRNFLHYRNVYDRALELWKTGEWSQVAIGKLLGISNACVSKWVNGHLRPR